MVNLEGFLVAVHGFFTYSAEDTACVVNQDVDTRHLLLDAGREVTHLAQVAEIGGKVGAS